MSFYRVKYLDRTGEPRTVWRGTRAGAIAVGELLNKQNKVKLSTVVEIEIVEIPKDKASFLAALNRYATHGDKAI